MDMPLVGLGQAGITQPDVSVLIERTVEQAVELGYRHFDTAYSYGNERPIGNALKKCITSGLIRRQDLFITTKLPCVGMQPSLVEKFLRLSLENLQMTYVDLYLMHWPIGFKFHNDPSNLFPKKEEKLDLDFTTDLEEIWRAMELACDKGLVRAIGLSNFNQSQISRITTVAKIPPANLQVELHGYLQQQGLVRFCQEQGISLCAYAPLGSPGRIDTLRKRDQEINHKKVLDDPEVIEIAKFYGRTPAQILLRFLVQQNIAVIPRTTNLDRLRANLNVLDFQLTKEDMQQLKSLDKGDHGRIFDFSAAPEAREHPEFPF